MFPDSSVTSMAPTQAEHCYVASGSIPPRSKVRRPAKTQSRTGSRFKEPLDACGINDHLRMKTQRCKWNLQLLASSPVRVYISHITDVNQCVVVYLS